MTYLEWTDDPLILAGTGRRAGTLDDARARVLARYPTATFEGPRARSAGDLVALLHERPDDWEDRPHAVRIAALVDRVRAGEITRERYAALASEAISAEALLGDARKGGAT